MYDSADLPHCTVQYNQLSLMFLYTHETNVLFL